MKKFLSIVIIALVASTIWLAFRVWSKMQTATPPTNAPSITEPNEPKTVQPQNTAKAFIKIIRATDESAPGEMWSVELSSNDWSKCLVDLYTPEEKVYLLSIAKAKAQVVAPGKYYWSWVVPTDAKKGTWTARFLCGTGDNLATMDQQIRVR